MTYVFTLLMITLRFLSATNLNKIIQRPCDYRTTIARLSCSHRVIFTTSSYKVHDVLTMTLWKSQGVGTLNVRLSCYYLHSCTICVLLFEMAPKTNGGIGKPLEPAMIWWYETL